MTDPWLVYAGDPDQPVRLFCIPYAGGGPRVFRHWTAARDGIAVAALHLPGRERRIGEPTPATFAELMPPLVAAIAPHLDRPYALFGHSAGARVALELARRLRAAGLPPPAMLFVSAARPPHTQRQIVLHELPDQALGEWLVALGGMPRTLLEDADLVAATLPVLRADLRLLPDPCPADDPLACPVRVFAGVDDPEVGADLVDGWREYTTGEFGTRLFPGGHFFLRRHHQAILADVAAHLRAALSPAAPARIPSTSSLGDRDD